LVFSGDLFRLAATTSDAIVNATKNNAKQEKN
jgi:hypothetical protein